MKMKNMTVNDYLNKTKSDKHHKQMTLPQLLNEAHEYGCNCTIEELSANLWNLYN